MKLKLLVTLVAASALALVPTAAAATPYSEGFESGAAKLWTLTGLWNVNDCIAASGTYALVYNVHPQCNYDVGYSNGAATTPPIVVQGPSSLNFESYIQTEQWCGAYDVAHVLVSVNDGPYNVVLNNLECGPDSAWTLYSVDLTPYVGNSVRVQFYFDTGDGWVNNYLGWAIDNVAISGPAYPTPELGSLALAGAGVAVVAGVALVNRRK
ncbi:MAG TPA: choice-of-anchor J domain-containing protein [Candidatus Thermoplasmatota archaeon]|nr:choice-of-anchor J domain-containing protein [Candidatus Thermoplasmatota archaeon]